MYLFERHKEFQSPGIVFEAVFWQERAFNSLDTSRFLNCGSNFHLNVNENDSYEKTY